MTSWRLGGPASSARSMLAVATSALTLFAALQPKPRRTSNETRVRVGGSALDLQAWSEAHLKAQESEARSIEQRQSRNMARIWADLQEKRLNSDQADGRGR